MLRESLDSRFGRAIARTLPALAAAAAGFKDKEKEKDKEEKEKGKQREKEKEKDRPRDKAKSRDREDGKEREADEETGTDPREAGAHGDRSPARKRVRTGAADGGGGGSSSSTPAAAAAMPPDTLLLACRWFDARLVGYLEQDDLEDLLPLVAPELTRECETSRVLHCRTALPHCCTRECELTRACELNRECELTRECGTSHDVYRTVVLRCRTAAPLCRAVVPARLRCWCARYGTPAVSGH
eukprot:293432-Chlamydomonas_euryale.AAC.1